MTRVSKSLLILFFIKELTLDYEISKEIISRMLTEKLINFSMK